MKVSIIIPTIRPKQAQLAIQAVLKQKPDKSTEFEILPIAGKGNLNPGQRRNIGAKKATGEVLLFLDDDCLPQEGWLEENLKALSVKDIGAVGGKVIGKSKSYFARCVDLSNFTFAQGDMGRVMPICAASFAIKRAVFNKVGGFNEKIWVGEDTDLCMRLNGIGYKTIYQPKIKVIHDHGRKTLKALWSYQYRNGYLKGLGIENCYPNNPWYKFLKLISSPYLYWAFVFPFAVVATFIALAVNVKEDPLVIFYLPGIFIGKLAVQIGIYVWILKKPLILAES